MKPEFKKRVGFLLTLLFVTNAYAQRIKLPFELSKDNKSIFIKLPMENQKDSLRFLFDTGAATTLLDQKIAEKYSLKVGHKLQIMGAGGKNSYDALNNHKIFLDKNHYVDSTNIILGDLSRIASLEPEKKFDGIIGAAILRHYLTEIDIETHTFNLYEFDDPVDYSGYEKIPFEFYSGIPKFPITFELKNNEKFSGDILFDSGAGVTLLVNTPYTEKNDLLNKIGEKIRYNGSNLSNQTNYNKGLIESIQLGKIIIKKKNLGIFLSSDKQGVSSAGGLLGILGSEIINRFNFILDYNNKNIYLKPNPLFYKDFEMPVKPTF